eukprot:m51a1_g722 putative domain containing protein (417) ;mRNA; r:454478-456315
MAQGTSEAVPTPSFSVSAPVSPAASTSPLPPLALPHRSPSPPYETAWSPSLLTRSPRSAPLLLARSASATVLATPGAAAGQGLVVVPAPPAEPEPEALATPESGEGTSVAPRARRANYTHFSVHLQPLQKLRVTESPRRTRESHADIARRLKEYEALAAQAPASCSDVGNALGEGLLREEEREVSEAAAAPPQEPRCGGDDKREWLRSKAIAELVDTERSYLADLNKTISTYVVPLVQVIPEEHTQVFGKIESLVSVNSELLRTLEAGEPVGRCFLDIGDYLKMYTFYCCCYDSQVSAVRRLRKTKPEFNKFLEEVAAASGGTSRDIESLLIRPVQRICRYPLLLKEILKHTAEEDEEHHDIQTALEKLEEPVQVFLFSDVLLRTTVGRFSGKLQFRGMSLLEHINFSDMNRLCTD